MPQHVLYNSKVVTSSSEELKPLLIHEADPQPRPVVITVFTHGITNFQNLAKQNNFQLRLVIITDGTVSLAEGIIDDTHVLFLLSLKAFYAANV